MVTFLKNVKLVALLLLSSWWSKSAVHGQNDFSDCLLCLSLRNAVGFSAVVSSAVEWQTTVQTLTPISVTELWSNTQIKLLLLFYFLNEAGEGHCFFVLAASRFSPVPVESSERKVSSDEWMMHLHSALLSIAVHPKRLYNAHL